MTAWILESTLLALLVALLAVAASPWMRTRPALAHVLWVIVLVRLLVPPISLGHWPPQPLREAVSEATQLWRSPVVDHAVSRLPKMEMSASNEPDAPVAERPVEESAAGAESVGWSPPETGRESGGPLAASPTTSQAVPVPVKATYQQERPAAPRGSHTTVRVSSRPQRADARFSSAQRASAAFSRSLATLRGDLPVPGP